MIFHRSLMDRRRETKTIKKNEKIYSQCVVTAGSVDNGFAAYASKPDFPHIRSRYLRRRAKNLRTHCVLAMVLLW